MFLNKTYNDIIFEHRNKLYGAYELRNSYFKNIRNAVIFTSSLALFFSLGLSFYIKYAVNQEVVYEDVDYKSIIYSADEVLIPNILPDEPAPAPKGEETPKKEDLPPVVKEDTQPKQPEKKIENDTKTESKVNENTISGTTAGTDGGSGNKGNDLKSVSNDTTGTALYTNEIFMNVDQGAEFQGGKVAFAEYLRKNIVYPTYATENKVNGIIFVHIVVNRDGSLQDFRLYKGIEKSCNEEVMRVVKMMPNWIPARKNGINVRQRLIIPINFNALN
jgi:periplasmic protein TonB